MNSIYIYSNDGKDLLNYSGFGKTLIIEITDGKIALKTTSTDEEGKTIESSSDWFGSFKGLASKKGATSPEITSTMEITESMILFIVG